MMQTAPSHGGRYDVLIANIGSHVVFEEDLRGGWREAHEVETPRLAELLAEVSTQLGKQVGRASTMLRLLHAVTSARTRCTHAVNVSHSWIPEAGHLQQT